MPLQALQAEIPDPGQVDPALYRETGLADPRRYAPDYWAALALFANPLLWFAPSLMSASLRENVRTAMALHRRLRGELHDADVAPLGDEPDGRAVSGFAAGAYRLWFREAGAANSVVAPPDVRLARIAGDKPRRDADGWRLPRSPSWTLVIHSRS